MGEYARASLRVPYRLSAAIAVLMLLQSSLGLLFRDLYRDVEWIRATWFGNDLVTLAVVLPLLAYAVATVPHGRTSGILLMAGTLGYSFYNYAYYLFGAALNAFFPLYVVLFVLSGLALILLAAGGLDAEAASAAFRPKTPVRLVGGYLVFTGTVLAFVWFLMWGAYVFAGRPTPVEPEAFKLVAAIDTSIIVPFLIAGGWLLLKRKAWGYVLAPLAGIQSSLYLFVLSVNSLIAVVRGLAKAPGELPVWGTLFLLTFAATALLLSGIRKHGTGNGR